MYLLSTSALLDAATGTHASMKALLADVGRRELHISVISFGRASYEIEMLEPSRIKQDLQGNLRELVALAETNNHLLGLDRVTALEWAALLAMKLIVAGPRGGQADLDDDSRAVVATALQYNLTLIEEAHPYHSDLAGRLRVKTY